ncbi:DsbA family protein [Ralstonia solanacearum]|uniref:DsbA family protein n=1 Tax=Ralstonia solanacearum TaxID=305 RepID=A0AAE3T2X5_RALSL|nr:DsbA family protein [Ralstonia solanacearum]MBB6584838.1 DsbA family protein [Ralstonia solanacearum]MDB0520812.1 DsbA family protein [Ralstonia solanacearum]
MQTKTQNATLHYLYDPFCGWCYASAPVISAIQSLPGLTIQAHGLGMLSGEHTRWMAPDWRDFVRPHEQRIHALSGQPFGAAYTEGVQERTDVRLDSSPPIAAMLAAESLAGRGIEMLKRLQVAYYQEGRSIAETPVILELAAEIGLDTTAFAKVFDTVSREQVKAHLETTQDLLHRLQVRGVPAFALDRAGALHLLPFNHYLNRPQRFKENVLALMQAEA